MFGNCGPNNNFQIAEIAYVPSASKTIASPSSITLSSSADPFSKSVSCAPIGKPGVSSSIRLYSWVSLASVKKSKIVVQNLYGHPVFVLKWS